MSGTERLLNKNLPVSSERTDTRLQPPV